MGGYVMSVKGQYFFWLSLITLSSALAKMSSVLCRSCFYRL